MDHTVTVYFSPAAVFCFPIADALVESIEKAIATDWFNTEFESLGCSSRNPTGKIIMRNVVVDVAKTAGAARFIDDKNWAQSFSQHCAVLFRHKNVHIDVPAMTLLAN